MKVIVDRSRWLRGEGGSVLQRMTDGKRCCIGFACLAAGVPEGRIINAGNPQNLIEPVFDLGPWHMSSRTCDDPATAALYAAFAINDTWRGTRPISTAHGLPPIGLLEALGKYGADPILDDADREARLVRLFADQGLDLVFVDGPADAEGAP